MRTRLSAALDGIELHGIDPAICIQRIREDAPGIEISTGNRAGGSGQHLNSLKRKTMVVSIQFGIDLPKRETLRRAEILQQVSAWAQAGRNLTVNYRDRQKLRVRCTGLPEINGIDRWTENYEIEFRTMEIPFWQSMDRTSVSISATASGNTEMRIRETGGGLLCCEAVNGSGSTVDTAAIAVNGRNFTFAGLGLANGETLRCDYDEDGIQRIRILGTGGVWRSAMAARHPISHDDLILQPGQNTVYVSSGAALSWTVWTFGRWL